MQNIRSNNGWIISSNGALLFAAAVWIGAVVHAVAMTEAGFFLLRTILSLMFLVWTVVLYLSRKPILLLSPLFVLGLFALLAYSLVEVLYALIPDWLSHRAIDQSIIDYSGSWGEALVLQFVAFCLLVTAGAVRISHDQVTGQEKLELEPYWNGIAVVAAGVVVVLLICEVSIASFSKANQFTVVGIGKQLAHSVEPLTAFCFAVLAFVACMRGYAVAWLFLGLIGVYIGVRTAMNLVQMPILIVATAIVFYLISGVRRVRTIASAVLAATLIITAVFYGIAQSRYTWLVEKDVSALQLLKTAASSKGIIRQGRAAACFNKVVSHLDSTTNQQQPFYFLSAVVPRVLWPEKPVVSRGVEYGERYCGAKAVENNQHYELISLLGEPILMGGVIGLAVAQAFMAICLFAFSLAMVRAGPVSLIAVVALLPWLIHYQQSFALYFANTVKMFFYMLPAIALLWWWTRRQKTIESESLS